MCGVRQIDLHFHFGFAGSKADSCTRQTDDETEPKHKMTALCYELVEAVRVETNLSHSGSRLAVLAVLRKLGEKLRNLGPELRPLVDRMEECSSLSTEFVAGSRDAVKLRSALNELMKARFDEQQRGWHLHEDEASILACLDSILDTMVQSPDAPCKMHRRLMWNGKYSCRVKRQHWCC